MTPISKDLYDVLVAWREDAMSAEPSSAAAELGLCIWTIETNLNALDELHKLLVAEFPGRATFPFCNGFVAYKSEIRGRNAHLNPNRRAWVDAKIEEYEAAQSEVAAS